MDILEITCCFTGHRPQSLPWGYNEEDPRCQTLKDRLDAEICRLTTEAGVKHYISGMALGVDTWAAEAVLRVRDEYPTITLECAIPHEEQAARWRERDRNRYFGLVERCDFETMVQLHYDKDCMLRRNRYMVEKSKYVIAVWDGRPSGSGQTVMLARELGRTVYIIDPTQL